MNEPRLIKRREARDDERVAASQGSTNGCGSSLQTEERSFTLCTTVTTHAYCGELVSLISTTVHHFQPSFVYFCASATVRWWIEALCCPCVRGSVRACVPRFCEHDNYSINVWREFHQFWCIWEQKWTDLILRSKGEEVSRSVDHAQPKYGPKGRQKGVLPSYI